MAQITCPHCAKECAVTTTATKRPSSEIAKGFALILITLATAFAGCYGAIRFFAYEMVSGMEKRERDRAAERNAEWEANKDRLRRQVFGE